jgi:hypothetical protein
LPFSALLFMAYALLWLFDNPLWPEARQLRPSRGEPQDGAFADNNL